MNNFTLEDARERFLGEFKFLEDKFIIFDRSCTEARESKENRIWNPGVYIWWEPDKGIVKVGRHLTNSRKRAFEHIDQDTGGHMKEMGENPGTRLLLLNVREVQDLHWVAALEIFLEKELSPCIRSKRTG